MLPVVFTIAGSDPSGGAGLQADLKTFAACKVYGAGAITALTVQNTQGVTRSQNVDAALLSEQIAAVQEDLEISAIKTGMLAGKEQVQAVARRLAVGSASVPLVIDPVIQSSSGAPLLDAAGVDALRQELLPLALVVTPNLAEAQVLTGHDTTTPEGQLRAIEALLGLGAKAVVLTGGHQLGAPVDLLHDGHELHKIDGKRVQTTSTHGTGCSYSAALAAFLARRQPLQQAATLAKTYVTGALQGAPGWGHGRGPLHHLHPWYSAHD